MRKNLILIVAASIPSTVFAIAACAGFTGTDEIVGDAGSEIDTGTPNDATTIADSNDATGIADSGAELHFGKPTLVREKELISTATFNTDRTAFYIGRDPFVGGHIFIAMPPDAGAGYIKEEIKTDAGVAYPAIEGNFPSVARSATGTTFMFYNVLETMSVDGGSSTVGSTIFVRSINESSKLASGPLRLTRGSYPYVVPNLEGIYFTRGATLMRAVIKAPIGVESEAPIEVSARDGGTLGAALEYVVVTADERTIYFNVKDTTTPHSHIWVASRAGGSSPFSDAHPLVFEGSDPERSEFPTWVRTEPNGTRELIFARLYPSTEGGILPDIAIYSLQSE